MPDAESLRRHAAQYHQFADDTLKTCRRQPACDICQRAADGYRAIALDHTQRAVWQDILTGVVHQ